MLSNELLTPRDSLDALVSYSIAEEGTNTLYIRLVESMLLRCEDYSLVEVEMVLNYFPHGLWKDDPALSRLRETFYHPMIEMIREHIAKVDTRQFLSLFQGLTLVGASLLRGDILNIVLNSFVQR